MVLLNPCFHILVSILLPALVISDSSEHGENSTDLSQGNQPIPPDQYDLFLNLPALNVTESTPNYHTNESVVINWDSPQPEDIIPDTNVSSLLTLHQDIPNFTVNTTSSSVILEEENANSTTPTPETPLSPELHAEAIKEKALGNLMQIFGISKAKPRDAPPGPAPEFMIELYNTITDSYGVTRAKNPYDAHVVRTFSEKEITIDDNLYFNITGLEETETILEAELHIHRLQTPHEQLHPSLYLTPFYILSLYQVLDPSNLAIPDLHQLLGVHYVPALGSGWEVFNVKRSVLKWMNGQPNYGFLVVATSLGGDRVPVTFSRRRAQLDNKQPILVLFTQDLSVKTIEIQPKPKVTYAATTPSNNSSKEEEMTVIPNSSLEIDRFHHALLYKDSIRHPDSVNRYRSRRSKNQTESTSNFDESKNLTCSRRDLFVNFEAIGWSPWIISPKRYNAYYCTGPCNFPLDVDVKSSNHATIQSIVHELKIAPGIEKPCCVPTTLLPISLLYYDNEDNVVLKQYVNMVVEQCGCS